MEIRDLEPSDLDAALGVRARSFSPLGEAENAAWRTRMRRAVADGRVLAAYDGARVAGMARINAFTQWWYGRPLPMAGIGGVVVAPEDRGTGVGRLLMTATLDRAADKGYPLSALYPATTPLYRSLGWEHAGIRQALTIPTETLRTLDAPRVALLRASADDVDDVLATLAAAHSAHRDSGPILLDDAATREWLADPELFCYLAADGFVAYGWDGSTALNVECLVARSAATSRALWRLVGSGSSIAGTVRAYVAPHDPIRWLTREAAARQEFAQSWMLRVVDAPAAIAGRGFPPGVALELVLTLGDEQRAGNAGAWRLSVSDQRGELSRVPESSTALRLGAGGFAALYAGVPVATLRRAGLAVGGEAERDAQLDAAFTGQAFMPDYF